MLLTKLVALNIALTFLCVRLFEVSGSEAVDCVQEYTLFHNTCIPRTVMLSVHYTNTQ